MGRLADAVAGLYGAWEYYVSWATWEELMAEPFEINSLLERPLETTRVLERWEDAYALAKEKARERNHCVTIRKATNPLKLSLAAIRLRLRPKVREFRVYPDGRVEEVGT